jgi:membrane-bound metal-dependent hydrolase YbcI (DUF457 family)
VEPVTHALTAVVLARGGLNRATRWGTPLVLLAGLAPDLDWFSRWAGPYAFLEYHRAVTHSLAGAAALAALLAGAWWRLGRGHPTAPVRFGRAFGVAACGVASHLALDILNSDGMRPFWPFGERRYAFDLLPRVDPWILFLLALGLLLPALLRLVTEEIGARPERRGPQRGAVTALVLLAALLGARFFLHERALETLNSRMYRGEIPLSVAALPTAASPFVWDGVVETEGSLDQVEVRLTPGSYFDPDRARPHFKPEPSPLLDAARETRAAQAFLRGARFPRASVERVTEGMRVELRDLRDADWMARRRAVVVTIEFNRDNEIVREELRIGPPPRRR